MMTDPKLKIKLHDGDEKWKPVRATDNAAALDLKARVSTPVEILPGEVVTLPTGVYVQCSPGWAPLVLPRSGLAYKFGLTVVNSPGLIDPDYRGEIKVILGNLKTKDRSDAWSYTTSVRHGAVIEPEARIAQLLIVPYWAGEIRYVRDLDETSRGEGGLGSTGN